MKIVLVRGLMAMCLLLQLSACSAQIKTLNGKTIATKDMEKFLLAAIDSLHIPSVSVAFINDGKIVYHTALGYADLEKHIKADDKTIYEAASISKIVFGYFIMRMVDR